MTTATRAPAAELGAGTPRHETRSAGGAGDFPADDGQWTAMRASDADRSRAVERLAGAMRAGYLGVDTFEARVADAYAARSPSQLRTLTADLPRRAGTLWRWLGDAARWFWDADDDADDDVLVLRAPPARPPRPFLIGRWQNCGLVLDDPTVSRVHARLVPREDGWAICDMQSTNGTRVNGWRVEEAVLGDGDEVMVGAVRVRFRGRS
jgi:hypothetical protein